MAKTLAHLLVRLGVDSTEFGTRMKAAEKTMESVASGMRKAGNALSIGVTAPMLAAGGAALKFAIDATESENLFTVSMGKMADAGRSFSEGLRDQLGLNSYEVRENLGVLDQMLKSMGLNEDAAYGMATGMTKLAYDMASFFNLKPEEAFEKLRSGITGEAEPLKRLGILVDETTIKQEAWNAGLVKAGQELTQTEKIQARYLAIMRQTSAAQGDLARTIDSPANELRRLQSEAKETAIEFGKALIPLLQAALPTIKDLAGYVRGAADALAKMDPETRNVAFGILGLIAAAGPATKIFGGLVSAGGGLAKIMKTAAAEARTLAKVTKTAAAAGPELVSAHIQMAQAAEAAATRTALLNAGLVALAAGAGVAIGTAIRPWVNEVLGLNEALGLAADKNQDLLDALVSDKDVFDQQLDAYNAARKSLGLLGDQWVVNAEHTEQNAGRLAHLLTELEEVRKAHLEEAFAVRQATDARGSAIDQVNRHLERIKKEDAALSELTDRLKDTYGVLSRKDVTDQMNALVADFVALSREGISGAQLMEKFAPKVKELSEAAAGYTDLNLPTEFQQLQYVLEQGLTGWVEQFGQQLGRNIPDAAGQARLALSTSIGQGMLDAKKKVDEETKQIRNTLAQLAGEEFKIKVTIDPNSDEFLRKLKELGLQPSTTGSAG